MVGSNFSYILTSAYLVPQCQHLSLAFSLLSEFAFKSSLLFCLRDTVILMFCSYICFVLTFVVCSVFTVFIMFCVSFYLGEMAFYSIEIGFGIVLSCLDFSIRYFKQSIFYLICHKNRHSHSHAHTRTHARIKKNRRHDITTLTFCFCTRNTLHMCL